MFLNLFVGGGALVYLLLFLDLMDPVPAVALALAAVLAYLLFLGVKNSGFGEYVAALLLVVGVVLLSVLTFVYCHEDPQACVWLVGGARRTVGGGVSWLMYNATDAARGLARGIAQNFKAKE